MKLTRVTAEFTFEGDIDGQAKVEYLMFYSSFDPEDMHKAQAQYLGQIRIIGSGTGELAGISGVGEYAADQKGCTWEMEISLGSI